MSTGNGVTASTVVSSVTQSQAVSVASTSGTLNEVSVLSVLQTALPSSLVAEALTNSAAVSSEIASEFSVGSTPAWFESLPSDIQTYLVPAIGSTTTTPTADPITSQTSIRPGSSTLQQSSASTTSQQSVVASASHSPAPIKTTRGLSTGAAIGIGIGIAIVAIAVAAALAFLWYRRYKRRKEVPETQKRHGLMDVSESTAMQDTGNEKNLDGATGEMITRANTHELHAEHGTSELGPNAVQRHPYELPGVRNEM